MHIYMLYIYIIYMYILLNKRLYDCISIGCSIGKIMYFHGKIEHIII